MPYEIENLQGVSTKKLEEENGKKYYKCTQGRCSMHGSREQENYALYGEYCMLVLPYVKSSHRY